MHRLVRKNDLEGLRVALAADPHPRDIGSAFQSASQWPDCDPRIIDLLLASGVDSFNLTTGLGYAAGRGIPLFVEKILAYDPNQTASSGDTALYKAAVHGHAAVIEILAPNSPVLDYLGETEHRTAPDGRQPLLGAIQHGLLDGVMALLAAGASVNFATRKSRSPLDMARALKRTEIAAALEAAGAQEVDPSWLDLVGAARIGAWERYEELVDDADEKTLTNAIHAAAFSNRAAFVGRACARGLPQTLLDDTLSKALHHHDVAQALLDGGANIDGTNAQGKRPLYWAARSGAPEILHWLIDRGASVDARDPDGETALHRAADYGQAENARALLERGADPKAQTRDSTTPAMLARHYPEVTKVLKTFGARPTSPAAVKRALKKKLVDETRDAWKPRLRAGNGGDTNARIGGLAWLPAGETWPTCACGAAYRFVAQLDLSALPFEAGEGLAQAFHCPTCSASLARVIAIGVGAVGETDHPWPAKHITGFNKPKTDYPGDPEDTRLRLIPPEPDHISELNLAGLKVGGWPHWIQQTGFVKGATRLLLQLDCGGPLPYEFGDSGIAFLLQDPDTPSRVVFVTQSL